jgi:glycosyltransferase involved in cell wall biosynthesis
MVSYSISVSICIPTYNQTKYLRKTLDSILSQTYKDYELIISDDSSTEDVSMLLEEYKDKLSFKYVRNRPSLGSPQNWNHSLSLAKGKWIKIMHHDDWFSKSDALWKMMSMAEINPNALIFAGIKGEFVLEKRSYINLPSQYKIKELQEDPFSLIWANVIGPPSTILFPNIPVKFDKDLIWLVDIEFYLKLLLKHRLQLVYIEEVLFENCPDDHNITNVCFQNKSLELREYNYVFNKVYPKPTFKTKFNFMKLLKSHISTYSRVNFIELYIAQHVNKNKP